MMLDKDIPLFFRKSSNLVLGLGDSDQARQIVRELNERIGVSTKATPKRRELVRYFDKSVSNAFIEDPEERYENAL